MVSPLPGSISRRSSGRSPHRLGPPHPSGWLWPCSSASWPPPAPAACPVHAQQPDRTSVARRNRA